MDVLIFNTIFADVVLILAVTYFEYWPKYVLKTRRNIENNAV